jgi:hypothetical protein
MILIEIVPQFFTGMSPTLANAEDREQDRPPWMWSKRSRALAVLHGGSSFASTCHSAQSKGRPRQADRPNRTRRLPAAQPSRARVRSARGYSHVTAAEIWELGVLHKTKITHITVPRTKRVEVPANTKVHYADLPPEATDGRTTRPLQTVLDCARTCRFDEALAIADTAVRVRMVTKPVLIKAAAGLRGAGSRQARRIAALCDERSHSPLESALRALLIEAGLIFFEPQYAARAANGKVLAKVDLGDPVTGVLLEADSFLFHGHRGQLEWDARRYNALVAHGFLVLRFAYEHVLGDKDWVVDTVKRTLALRGRLIR